MRNRRKLLLVTVLATLPLASAQAFDLKDELKQLQQEKVAETVQDLSIAQKNGKTLSEAIDQVRSRTKGRIISAETKVKGGREVHHIKVLTKDGKVKRIRIDGDSGRRMQGRPRR